MTSLELSAVRSVLSAGLPAVVETRLRATAGGADWAAYRSMADLRNAVVGGSVFRAPDVLVVGYARRSVWSVRVLISAVLGLPGAVDTRVLLVTEGPRAALPVWLTDESRLEVVPPDGVEARMPTLLGARPWPPDPAARPGWSTFSRGAP